MSVSRGLPEISAGELYTQSTLHLNDERINTAMFAPKSALPLSTHKTQQNILFIYYLYIESVSSMFILWNVWVRQFLVRSENATSAILYEPIVRLRSVVKTFVGAVLLLGPLEQAYWRSYLLFFHVCVVGVSLWERWRRRACAFVRQRWGTTLARLFMKEVRVNERAPSAGVAYCSRSLDALISRAFFHSPCA